MTLWVTAGSVAAIASVNGGYNPALWGWITLVALAVTAAVLGPIPRSHPTVSRRQIVWLVGFATLTAYTICSAIWTADLTATALASERTLLYLAVVVAAVVTLTAARVVEALRGLTVGIVVVCVYGLATRLEPEYLHAPTGGVAGSYKLMGTLGYWNALGVFAAVGVLVAFGLATRGCGLGERLVWAGCLPLLAVTTYFTFSRGAEACLALGLVVMMLVDPQRVVVLAFALGCAPGIALAVVFASGSHALNDAASTVAERAHAGASFLPMLAAGMVVSAAGAGAVGCAQRYLRGRGLSKGTQAGAAAIAMLAAAGLAITHHQAPPAAAHRAYLALASAPDRRSSDLRSHLSDPSSDNRIAFWKGAISEFRDHPLLGAGAGGFERFWDRHRGVAPPGRNANSVYLEALGELGVVGAALLGCVLVIPLVSGFRIRRTPLGPTLLGAYSLLVSHAAIDWDWQVPAVTATMLVLGALVVALDGGAVRVALGNRLRLTGLVVVSGVALIAVVTAVGNGDIAAASQALASGNPRAAQRDAQAAKVWMPWSDEPWGWEAESRLAQGQLRQARAGFRQAIARDGDNWEDWFGLARATAGKRRESALAHAQRLNPGAPEISQFCRHYRIRRCR